MLEHLKIHLALWLTKTTKVVVVRRDAAQTLQDDAMELTRYVHASGGLQDPKRINAFKIVTRAADSISRGASRLLVKQPILLDTPSTREDMYAQEGQQSVA